MSTQNYIDDRSWMGHRIPDSGPGVSTDFRKGVAAFLEFAFKFGRTRDNSKIRCPCRCCGNQYWEDADTVSFHLHTKGFAANYTRWVLHGELDLPVGAGQEGSTSFQNAEITPDESDHYDCSQMVLDAIGHLQYEWGMGDDNLDNVVDEGPTEEAKDFYDLLRSVDEPLYEGFERHTRMSALTRLLHHKSEHGQSERAFNDMINMFKEFSPEGIKFPKDYYEVKQLIKRLGLGYERIDACEKDCVLYRGEYKDLRECPKCKRCRYVKRKPGSKGKDIACKVLRYFPITPRLKRLYMSKKTAKHMIWHGMRTKVDGELRHPSDGMAWKEFDAAYPSFAADHRNAYLAIATDGFNPFSGRTYSCWPVISVVYNLPPNLCMKDAYMYLTLLIPGDKSPTKEIGVYLQPLIDELKMLWDTGVLAYDAHTEKRFNLRAALMWTINDFPAYGMIASWCTHGLMSCPVCMKGDMAFTLKHGRKPSYFASNRQFLPVRHRFRLMSKEFNGKRESRQGPERKSGSFISTWLSSIKFPPPGKEEKIPRAEGYGQVHHWTDHNVFFQLPYWPTNLLRHNLDVMHIEKNVFDNVFNTLMNVKGKTKDNYKSRLDLQYLDIRKELHPCQQGNKVICPKASYTFTQEQIQLVCKWVKELRLPDGYASNISKCCSIEKCSFSGMKSHDCHVFMQRLLPIMVRDLLPPQVRDALIELCHFFRDLCSTVLKEEDVETLEKNIVMTMCKLEMIFPPSFFDSMEHLTIHLAYEAKVGGPVQYRWMYPFERYMRRLKNKVHNKAKPEGSIAELYVAEELSNFCSLYFESKVDTVHNRIGRNEVLLDKSSNKLSIFTCHGEFIGQPQKRCLTDVEQKAAHLYAIMNMEEVVPYIEQYNNEMYESNPNITARQLEELRNCNFANWFGQTVRKDAQAFIRFKDVIDGPHKYAYSYRGYKTNGVRFHTFDYDAMETSNSGVVVNGSCYDDNTVDWYGRLRDVVQLEYDGYNYAVLFKCDWFDTRKVIKDKHGIVTVDLRATAYANEPFVLASQANQVCFVRGVLPRRDPNRYTVIRTKARSLYDLPLEALEMFQEDEIFHLEEVVIPDDFEDINLHASDQPGQEVDDVEARLTNEIRDSDNEFIDDSEMIEVPDDEEEEFIEEYDDEYENV